MDLRGIAMPGEERNKLAGERISESARLCVDGDMTVLDASRLMRSYRVATLVVAEYSAGAWVATGVLSARDIVTRVIAAGLDPSVVTAGDITWPECHSASVCDRGPDCP
jgi:CBS domain-containing protein